MKILALDASTEACSAAIYVNGEIIERLAITPRKHIEVLMPMIKEVMEESGRQFSDLDGLAFAAGPGSFAGLRIACGFIQGLGAGLNLPIVPVSTLETLALPVFEDHPEANVLTIMDAKMNEIYWAVYTRGEKGRLVTVFEDQVSSMDAMIEAVKAHGFESLYGVGDGFDLDPALKETLNLVEISSRKHPRAGEVALLAINDIEQNLGLYADQVSPIYLRHDIALTIEEQEAARQKKAAEAAAEAAQTDASSES